MKDALLPLLAASFRGPHLPTWTARALQAGLGGIVLFRDNCVDPEQTRTLTDRMRQLNPDVVVAVDEEGGEVSRLPWAELLSCGNAALGRIDDPDLTRAVHSSIGEAVAAAGIDVTLAPVVDLHDRDGSSAIGSRSFGAQPALVTRHAAAAVAGLRAAGVATCLKHFPGHGLVPQDSHLELPATNRPLADVERHLDPFLALAAAADAVMVGHLVVRSLSPRPVSHAPEVLARLRRGGFGGAVLTDAWDMAGSGGRADSAVRALQAGCDLVLLGPSGDQAALGAVVAAGQQALRDGAVEAERLAEARTAVLGLRRAAPPPGPGQEEGPRRRADRAAVLTSLLPPGALAGCLTTRSFVPPGGAAVLLDLAGASSGAVDAPAPREQLLAAVHAEADETGQHTTSGYGVVLTDGCDVDAHTTRVRAWRDDNDLRYVLQVHLGAPDAMAGWADGYVGGVGAAPSVVAAVADLLKGTSP